MIRDFGEVRARVLTAPRWTERAAGRRAADPPGSACRHGGPHGTTLAGIAAEAGVAVETIYTGFASKKALLLEAMNVAIVGDTLCPRSS
jgi:Bacterial regulatory proteins, tetR family